MRQKSTLPTQPTQSTRSETQPPPPCVVVALLREDTRAILPFPKHGGHVTIGRSEHADLYIDDTRVSRDHAYIERLPDRIVVRPRGRLRVEDLDVTKAVIRPGERFTLRGLGFIALSDAMVRAHPHLDRLVGDPCIVRDLLAMPRGKHAVLLGVQGALLDDIARHHHAALTGNDAPFVDATRGRDDDVRVPDIEALLPTTVNGRIFIDGRKRYGKGKTVAPRLARQLLERLAHPNQRTAITLAVRNQKEVDIDLVLTRCSHFLIPPIKDRIKSEEPLVRDHLIDAAFENIKSPWRVRHLHPDFIAALVTCPWSGDYKAFHAILYFAICVWLDKREEAATLHMIYGRRLTPWLREAGLSWERLRELPPDVGDLGRGSSSDA
mgnify:CR=1 FL=1